MKNWMCFFRAATPLALVLALVSGCATLGFSSRVRPAENPRLEDHVAYLAQPALHGRKPRSRGSRLAREYIIAHFQQAGLRPWAGADSFEQPVHTGVNVIGVLPGSDPALADEFVIVSAHYDHIGTGCLGACDNASGVATLLQLVDRFSQAPPRRSICFAAFDCEEEFLFGAFAFSVRSDFNAKSVAAVVNMDMLGRDLLDVVDRPMIVSGTHEYPATGQFVAEACAAKQLRFMPLGGDLVGPRSDHVAFIGGDAPCLFFTCGVFKGYHTKEDTIDRLDFAALADATDVVQAVVEKFANDQNLERAVEPAEPNRDELAAVAETLAALQKNADALDLSEKTRQALDKTQRELIAPCLEGPYTFGWRRHIAKSLASFMTGEIGTMILGGPVSQQDYAFGLMWLFNERPELLTRGYGGLVAHVIKHRPVPVIRHIPPYHYEALLESAPILKHHENGCWEFVQSPLTIKSDFKFRRFGIMPTSHTYISFKALCFYGTFEELADFLFAEEMSSDDTERQVITKALVDSGLMRKGADPARTRTAWLRGSGCKNHTDWINRMLASQNAQVAMACFKLMDAKPVARTPAAMAAVEAIAKDAQADSWLRLMALNAISKEGGKQAAELLAAASSDTTAVRPPFLDGAFDETHAFYKTATAAFYRSFSDDMPATYGTVGKHAKSLIEAKSGRRKT